MSLVRALGSADEATVDAFLAKHRDSSMFLRANARRAGLTYSGQPFEAHYAGAFRDGQLVGIAAHCWNGNLLMQAPQAASETSRACVELSGRSVTGFSGPAEQVREARTALGLDDAPASLDGQETLYGLDLESAVAPAIAGDEITCRPPLDHERQQLYAWRLAYDVETLGASDTETQRRSSAAFLDQQIAEENVWVAVRRGEPVSLSAINAALPDIVQLGGIYTPPSLRGRGYAKVAVAATLGGARDRGATRAVLFTRNPSAIRTYEALGFRPAGEYSLVLLETLA